MPLRVGVGLANVGVDITTGITGIITVPLATSVIGIISAIKAKGVTEARVAYVGY